MATLSPSAARRPSASGDIYDRSLPGQSIDITKNVPDGIYWLVSKADPDNLLAETDDGNNTGAVKFRLKGNRVQVLE